MLRDVGTLKKFSVILSGETNFVTFCLLSCIQLTFCKRIYSKRKELASGVHPFSKGRHFLTKLPITNVNPFPLIYQNIIVFQFVRFSSAICARSLIKACAFRISKERMCRTKCAYPQLDPGMCNSHKPEYMSWRTSCRRNCWRSVWHRYCWYGFNPLGPRESLMLLVWVINIVYTFR